MNAAKFFPILGLSLFGVFVTILALATETPGDFRAAALVIHAMAMARLLEDYGAKIDAKEASTKVKL